MALRNIARFLFSTAIGYQINAKSDILNDTRKPIAKLVLTTLLVIRPNLRI